MSYFWHLAKMIPALMANYWHITVALAVWLGFEFVATIRYLAKSKQSFRARWLLQLIPLAITICILWIGVMYRCQDCSPGMLRQFHDNSQFAPRINDGLLILQIGLSVLLVSFAHEIKTLFTALQAFFFFFSYWALESAYMSILNSWP